MSERRDNWPADWPRGEDGLVDWLQVWPWHRAFAWFPVHIDGSGWVWLKHYERRIRNICGSCDAPHYFTRTATPPSNQPSTTESK